MALNKRDFIFIAIVVGVFGLFFALSGEEKTTKVPYDDLHRPFYDMMAAGQTKKEIDPQCADCHDGIQIPFPADHPAKPGSAPMRCLFCHKMQQR